MRWHGNLPEAVSSTGRKPLGEGEHTRKCVHIALLNLCFSGSCQSLFMLVSALMGLERMKDVYAHAIENAYRFYSYGDSSLLIP
jgi:S-adenosylmethionine:tRNA-ribosyltransferase-isomerase (queuine synthetase)